MNISIKYNEPLTLASKVNSYEVIHKVSYTDSDGVEVCNLTPLKNIFPDLDWHFITNRFAWDIGDELFMAIEDLRLCIELTKQNLLTELDSENGYTYTDIITCSVCGDFILPDGECYEDYDSGDNICTNHSIYDSSVGMYRKVYMDSEDLARCVVDNIDDYKENIIVLLTNHLDDNPKLQTEWSAWFKQNTL